MGRAPFADHVLQSSDLVHCVCLDANSEEASLSEKHSKIYLPDTDKVLPRHVAMGFQKYSGFENFEEGGVAQLRVCLDKNLGRRVLMKSLHAHLSEEEMEQKRFLREARVTAQLQHPATVPVYELGRDVDGRLYFTMKRVVGKTLRHILEQIAAKNREYVDGYPLEERLNIFVQVCQAVAYAHAQGVIHRDLKPANIIVGEFGEVMLLDWGLAKVFDEPDEFADHVFQSTSAAQLALTFPGKRYGTPLYMSPEQAEGNTEVDERCDIYLLGSVLYEILTMKTLIWGDDIDEVLHRIMHEDLPRPRMRAPERKIPPELDSICMKALARRPEDRYTTVLELVDDIRRYLRDQPVSVHSDSVATRILKWHHRHVVSASTIAAFLFGVLFAMMLFFLLL